MLTERLEIGQLLCFLLQHARVVIQIVFVVANGFTGSTYHTRHCGYLLMYFFMNESGYNVGPFGMDENPNNTISGVFLSKFRQKGWRYFLVVVFAVEFMGFGINRGIIEFGVGPSIAYTIAKPTQTGVFFDCSVLFQFVGRYDFGVMVRQTQHHFFDCILVFLRHLVFVCLSVLS